jgi:hypothetical protein
METKELEEAFAGLGLDFGKLFPCVVAYTGHEWLVKTIPRVGLIINAVPPDAELGRRQPWEEWYKLEGRLHHHVLYLTQPPKHDEIFQAPEHDDIHPPRTLGKSWYVIEDPDMSPALLRAAGSG